MLQGGLVGPGIQGNIYNLREHKFFLFDVFDVDSFSYYNSKDRLELSDQLDIQHVPVVEMEEMPFPGNSLSITLPCNLRDEYIERILCMAEGKSRLADVEREGVVYKCATRPEISFKAISNKYLLKQG